MTGQPHHPTPLVAIVGKSKSGKTTLIEKLLPRLTARGYKIATIKHAFHAPKLDSPGKDSWRHMAAGASTVILSSAGGFGLFKTLADPRQEPALEELAQYAGDADLILTEGYKQAQQPKIEIFRTSAHATPLCLKDPHLIAMVTDAALGLQVPVFSLNDIETLSDFIIRRFLV